MKNKKPRFELCIGELCKVLMFLKENVYSESGDMIAFQFWRRTYFFGNDARRIAYYAKYKSVYSFHGISVVCFSKLEKNDLRLIELHYGLTINYMTMPSKVIEIIN